MVLSRSSRTGVDPLSAVLAALDARATRRAWLEAAGDWSLAFPALDRLKFVAVLRGACWIVPEGHPAIRMESGDVCLIGRTGYVVASDPMLTPVDGLALHEAGGDRLSLGGSDVLLLGSGVIFDAGGSNFLLELLPPVLTVERASAGTVAGTVATILSLLDREARGEALGSEAATSRLAELLVVEAFRASATAFADRPGWLGALADPRIGRALRAFHADVAQAWTVALLAAEAGMSRAAFSAAFSARVGQAPLAYARQWRLAIARVRLAAGIPIAQVAAEVGYASRSAFGHAFRRDLGASPGGRPATRGPGVDQKS